MVSRSAAHGFQVLPESLSSIDNVEFAAIQSAAARSILSASRPATRGFPTGRFAANQYYGARSGRNDLPFIREIHMARWTIRPANSATASCCWIRLGQVQELLGAKLTTS